MRTQVGLLIIPDVALRTPCKEVKEITSKIKKLIKKMKRLMWKFEGVGLAANQIGNSERVIVVDDGINIYEVINPEITYMSTTRVLMDEGCLSIPGIKSKVLRSVFIKVRGKNMKGEVKNYDLYGIASQAFQHEVDHLNGVLFIDRLSKVRKKMIYTKLKRLIRAIKRIEKR